MSNPKMRWHPTTGESQVFHDGDTVPEGWLDHHPEDTRHAAVEKQPDPKAKTVTALPMTRDEIKAALDAGEVPYAKNAKDQTLYDLLVESLRKHLTEAQIEFDPAADAKALLALVPPVTE